MAYMMNLNTRVSLQIPVVRTSVRSMVPSRRRTTVTPQAIFPLADIAPQVATSAEQVASQANQALPGSVSAPQWVIPVAALVVTVAGGAFAFLLAPGADAAEKVFERDAKRLGNQARNKAGQAAGKAKKTVKKARR